MILSFWTTAGKSKGQPLPGSYLKHNVCSSFDLDLLTLLFDDGASCRGLVSQESRVQSTQICFLSPLFGGWGGVTDTALHSLSLSQERPETHSRRPPCQEAPRMLKEMEGAYGL